MPAMPWVSLRCRWLRCTLLVLAVGAGPRVAVAQPPPTPPPPPPPPPVADSRQTYANALRQSLLEYEATSGSPRAGREEVLNVLGRSPTAVIEVAQAARWLSPVLEAMVTATPADQPVRNDLEALARRVREDATGPALLAFDNRVANWSLAASMPRPHTAAMEFARTFGLVPVADRSTMFDAAEVALVAMYTESPQGFAQPGHMDAALTMVTDSRLGLLAAMSSPGEANRTNTFLASNRLNNLDPLRLNERLRQALAEPPADAASVRGALDLARALRPLDPQTALWVQRTLGLSRREGTLLFEARDNGGDLSWRLVPLLRPGEGIEAPPRNTPAEPRAQFADLWPLFAELPRDGAQLAVAMRRDHAALILATYEELAPAGTSRTDQPASVRLEAEIDAIAGVSFRSTVAPLLGERLGLVVFPSRGGDSTESSGTLLLVVETEDELTLARLASTLLDGNSTQSRSLGEELGLAPGSAILMATDRERLALAVGPEAEHCLDHWRSARGHQASADSPYPHLDTATAQLVGWVDVGQWIQPASPDALPLWWTTRHRSSGELEIRGVVEASVARIAGMLVDRMPSLKTHDPVVMGRLELAKARIGAVDTAMRAYWNRYNEVCRSLDQLVVAQVGLTPEQAEDPFAEPPQALGLQVLGGTRWLISSVGPDGIPDPEDYPYNPRQGITSRGDVQVFGWIPMAGESDIVDSPRIP